MAGEVAGEVVGWKGFYPPGMGSEVFLSRTSTLSHHNIIHRLPRKPRGISYVDPEPQQGHRLRHHEVADGV